MSVNGWNKILIVDDTPANTHLLSDALGDEYQICTATNGFDAIRLVHAESPDLILLDVVMPGMDGYQVCETLQADAATRTIPVIFVTANTNPEHLVRGIEVGAFYYLTKPIDLTVLRAIVKSALSKTTESSLKQHDIDLYTNALRFLEDGSFRIWTREDAIHLSRFLARFCPDHDMHSIGLRELIINAVEHGLLGFSYEEKSRLLKENLWDEEVARREALPTNHQRFVSVRMQRTRQEIRFLIKDPGPGFHWEKFMVFDPARAFDCNGRGVLMSTQTLDAIQYLGSGNEVLAVVHAPEADSQEES